MVSKESSKSSGGFQRYSEYYADYRDGSHTSHFFHQRLQRVAESLSGLAGGEVLDAGCGPAFIAEGLDCNRFGYVGLDISPAMLNGDVERLCGRPRCRFLMGRMESIPCRDQSFDVVLCLGALEYVEDKEVALREFRRVLKPGGMLVLSMLNRCSPYRLWQDCFYWKILNLKEKVAALAGYGTAAADSSDPWGSVSMTGMYRLRKLLRAQGFLVRDLVYYDFNLFLSPLENMFDRASVYAARHLEGLGRSVLRNLGTGYLFTCIRERPGSQDGK